MRVSKNILCGRPVQFGDKEQIAVVRKAEMKHAGIIACGGATYIDDDSDDEEEESLWNWIYGEYQLNFTCPSCFHYNSQLMDLQDNGEAHYGIKCNGCSAQFKEENRSIYHLPTHLQ